MQITCPACAAAYSVPDALIGRGRTMRCLRCGHEWLVAPIDAAPEQLAPEAPPAEPAVSLGVPPLVKPVFNPAPAAAWRAATAGLPFAWAASVVAVGGGVLALWVFRARLAEAWPPLARIYAWLGA